MVNKNGVSILTVIVISLVVAVIASVATVSLTGNVIKVGSQSVGTDIYTKADVDAYFAPKSLSYSKSEIDSKLSGNLSVGSINMKNLFSSYVLQNYNGLGKPRNYYTIIDGRSIAVYASGISGTVVSNLVTGLGPDQIYITTSDGSSGTNVYNGFVVVSQGNKTSRYTANGIQLQSPNGVVWCCNPNNNGTISCVNAWCLTPVS